MSDGDFTTRDLSPIRCSICSKPAAFTFIDPTGKVCFCLSHLLKWAHEADAGTVDRFDQVMVSARAFVAKEAN